MLRTLPDDETRAIQWRFAGRDDLRTLVQTARGVARGPVARLVADGGRNSHEWTPEKDALLRALDGAGLTADAIEGKPGRGGGSQRNLALALVAFELAWVDGGAATTVLAGALARGAIRSFGTEEQKEAYLRAPAKDAGDGREPRHGAFALTEPIPYAGVETGLLGGAVRVAGWGLGREPVLSVEKRGRFITGMAFADFVTAVVASDDERIKGSCIVILERSDAGLFDRGTPARTLVHQLSSTRDPVFSLRVPAGRILGGYSVQDGVIVPSVAHGDVIETVFRRTRVTVGLMTAAKLLSAVEPLIRYQRRRFRGGADVQPGSPRFELGLQQKEDVLHRVIDIWAAGEAAASLGFGAARIFDALDGFDSAASALPDTVSKDAIEFLAELVKPAHRRKASRFEALAVDRKVAQRILDAVASVLSPAVKLWNTGHGADVMRDAVSLLGGQGLTENSPGFLGYKWMDAQLEATYEGPEAVQRRQLSVSMTDDVFLAQFGAWIAELRDLSSRRPGTGACALASAMELWRWTLRHLQHAADPGGGRLYQSARQGVSFPLADALAWMLSARQQVLDVVELERAERDRPAADAEQASSPVPFLTDLCHVQVARAAGEVSRICTELIFGYRPHPAWEASGGGSCYDAAELETLEDVIPGIGATARFYTDVVEVDGSHPSKAGPCIDRTGLEAFEQLRARLDGCLTGARLAKDRAAEALTRLAIPDEPGYPV